MILGALIIILECWGLNPKPHELASSSQRSTWHPQPWKGSFFHGWKPPLTFFYLSVTWALISDCAYQEFHSHLSQSYPEHNTASAGLTSLSPLSFGFILTARQQQKHIRQNWAGANCMLTEWEHFFHCQLRRIYTPPNDLVWGAKLYLHTRTNP